MTVEIPLEFQQFVHAIIGRGSYRSEADVVGSALALLRDREQRSDALRREIQPALDRLDRGEGIDLDEEGLDDLFEEIKAQHRAQPGSEQDSQ